MKVKKTIASLLIVISLAYSMLFQSISVSANKVATTKGEKAKCMIVDMSDLQVNHVIRYDSVPRAIQSLSKDFAVSSGQVGTIHSIGQIVDFRKIIPDKATIKNITIYCPTHTRMSKSKYTVIEDYVITNVETNKSATIPFWVTDEPSEKSKTGKFKGQEANVRFLVRLKGRILQQYSGLDGFTVSGGKMIIEYEEK